MLDLNNCEVDVSGPETDEDLTKQQSVIALLKKLDLLRYGALISEEVVEQAMGISKDEAAYKWDLIKLQFCEMIKSQGFYVTSRGQEQSLYILLPQEMGLYNDRKNKASYRNLKQRTRGLNMIDPSVLSEEHAKKLEFEILRNGSLLLEMAGNLKKRCRF